MNPITRLRQRQQQSRTDPHRPWSRKELCPASGHTQKMRVEAINRTGLDGSIALKGRIEAADKNSEIDLQVRNVDLALFEPYIVGCSEVRRGPGHFQHG